MLVGSARTSTLEQEAGLDAQLRDLKGVGCKKLFQEQVSSVVPRAQLEAALDERRTIRRNGFREEVVAWVPVLTTQAELVSLTMNEKATTAESLVAIFRLRYVDGIKSADQIELNGEFFDIKSVAEIGRRKGFEIHAVARP